MVTEPKEFFDFVLSDRFEVSDARLVNDETVEVHYKENDEFAEQDDKVNIVIAAFTTAYARLNCMIYWICCKNGSFITIRIL